MTETHTRLRLTEIERLRVQAELDALKTQVERNKVGQFATPPILANEVLRYVASLRGEWSEPIHFMDPALGSGSFLTAFLECFPQDIIASASGIEIDSAFASAAAKLWTVHGVNVIEGDATDPATWRQTAQRPNLIAANPPYVRHHHLTRDQKERLRQLTLRATGIDASGLSGLYVYFLLLCHSWLADGGIGAWLIPSEFMGVNYGSAVRDYLTRCVTLRALHRFDPTDMQFGDALVSSVVVVFEKSPPPDGVTVPLTYGGTLLNPTVSHDVPIHELRDSRKWTTYSKDVHENGSSQVVSEPHKLVLSDLFKIQRGIATGSNEFFILPRSAAIERGLPVDYLKPILPSPGNLKGAVIESASDGYPVVKPQMALVDCDLSEQAIRQRHKALWSYLQEGVAAGIADRYLPRHREPWYRQEQRPPAPFLCSYMGRGVNGGHPFRFFWNRSEATAPNVYLLLYPQGPLARLLRQRPALHADVFDTLCSITDHDFKGEGRVYGGGLHKIEPKELGRISAAGLLSRIPDIADSFVRQGVLAL